MRIEGYVEEFSKILKTLREGKWNVDFDEAEVSLAILREVAKDRRMENIERGDSDSERRNRPPKSRKSTWAGIRRRPPSGDHFFFWRRR